MAGFISISELFIKNVKMYKAQIDLELKFFIFTFKFILNILN